MDFNNLLIMLVVVLVQICSSTSSKPWSTEASFSFSWTRSKRSTSSSSLTLTMITKDSLMGSNEHNIRLRRQTQLVAPHFTLVLRKKDGKVSVNETTPFPDCLFVGHMRNDNNGSDDLDNDNKENVAISTCHRNKLQGVIRTDSGSHLMLEEQESSRVRRQTHAMSSGKLVITELVAKECGLKERNAKRMRKPKIESFALNLNQKDEKIDNEVEFGRRKRSTRSEKAIELAVFVDDELYEREKELFPNEDPVKVITDVVFAYLNSVQLMYTSDLLDTSFRLILVRLEIFESDINGLDKHEGDVEGYLDSFCTWQRFEKLRSRQEQWDHGLLLTGLDLFDGQPKHDSVIGLAWVAGMCHPAYSCTINEGSNFESVFVIAHEMGHNLGMNHDGERAEGNTCDPDRYLMSPVLGPGKVKWSPCSNQEINDFLDSRFTREQARCLDNLPPVMARYNYLREQQKPGEQFKAIEQCQKAFGQDFKPHVKDEKPFENPCRELWCANSTHALRAHPALEGTDCSAKPYPYGSVCQAGDCVPFDPDIREVDNDDENEEPRRNDNDNEDEAEGDEEEVSVDDNDNIEDRPIWYDPLFTQIFEDLRLYHGEQYPSGQGQTRIASMQEEQVPRWAANIGFCPAKCDGGWAEASFQCVDNDDNLVDDNLCDHEPRPNNVKRLCNIQPCA